MQFHFENAIFHPYVGIDYCQSRRFGLRVMVLGESHYEWPNMPRSVAETTRQAVKEGRQKGHFWGGISAKFETIPTTGSPSVWDSVAFYNYVQHFAGNKPRQRPTGAMWASKESVSGFKEVLRVLKPDRILVLGKTNWRMMAGGETHFPAEPANSRAGVSLTKGVLYESPRWV